MDIRQVLENSSIFIDKYVKIEGKLTKNDENWYIGFSEYTPSAYVNKNILIENPSQKEQSFPPAIQSRLSNFLRKAEVIQDKKYSLQEAEYYFSAFQQTGELEHLDVLRKIISEDELATLFPYFSGYSVTPDLYSQLNYVGYVNYKNKFFQASIIGKLMRTNSDEDQLILTDVQEIVLVREACTFYLHAVESQFDQLILNLLPATPLRTILTQREAYAEQIVSIKGTFFDYGIQHFIVPNTAYLTLKHPNEMAVMVDDFKFIEAMRKNILELLGGKFARVVDVCVVGKISLSDVFPKTTSITEITTAYIRERTITFKWENY